MLHDIGLEEGDLACGPHEPSSQRGAKILRESGGRPSRLHNNCSGKHTAMMALARHKGWPTQGYEQREHHVQRVILHEIALWTDVPCAKIGEEFPRRVVDAMSNHAFLVGGTDRFDSALIAETGGSVVSKVGAEGVHCALLPERGIGVAVKVEDGAQRAQVPALLRLLQELDALPAQLSPRLAEWMRRPVKNTRGECVGEVVMRADLA
jgi:L-asparaginase II